VRGEFKFGPNQFPVQNYYLQLVGKGTDGRLAHKTVGTVPQNRADAYAQDCKMK
jgi:branched-chain amino acid transport system substrate-binding protein